MIKRASVFVLALSALGCPATPDVGDPDSGPFVVEDAGDPADAGVAPPDAGPGVIDAGPRPEQGEACTFADAPACASGLFCLRPNLFSDEGVCQPNCGLFDGDGEVVGEDASLCPGGTTCQTLTTPTLAVLGAICQAAVTERDAVCEAPLDADACAGDLSCEVVFSEPILGEIFIDQPRCKLPCDFAASGTCDAPEVCLPPLDPLGDGLCGAPVPLWSGAPIPTAGELCNEISGHAYCDRRPLVDVTNPALVECLTGLFPDPNVGLCTARCSQPTLDYDGSGQVDDDEQAFARACPAGFACALDISRDNGLVEPVEPTVSCDDFICPPGEPCPTCPNNVECWQDPVGSPRCAAVFGNCVVAPVVNDAGPDAGSDGG